MKLNLLKPDARYDLEHGKPSSLEHDNDGSYIFRYNIKPDMGIKEGETEETQIGWMCREVRVWSQPTKSILKKAIIRSVIDESAEFALINSYNKHILEIKIDILAVYAYKEYLAFTEDVENLLSNHLNTNETN